MSDATRKLKLDRRLALLEAGGEPNGTGTPCATCEVPRTIFNTSEVESFLLRWDAVRPFVKSSRPSGLNFWRAGWISPRMAATRELHLPGPR